VSPAVVWQSTEVVDRANDPGWRERAEMDDLHASPFA
jgi:hypothetical protein